jgi:hypothetical protein
MERIDSCHSIWLFDTERMRFRRLPSGGDVDAPALERDWQPYYGLEIDADAGSFSVVLNEQRTRIIRSYRHTDPCPQCRDATGELTLEVAPPVADAAAG